MTDRASDSAILHAIMTAAVDAIIVSDVKGRILRANPAAEQLFGFGEGEMDGLNVKVLMPDEVASHHDGYMHRFIETDEKRIIGSGRQVTGQRKGGETFPLHLSIGEAWDASVRHFVAILHDTTHRVAADAAFSRSQRLDAIGQMTGGISHDFNNLLTVMIGNLELLEMHLDNERQLALSREALHAAEMAAKLTKGLMVFARQGNLKPVASDLREICKSTMALLKRTIGSKYTISMEFSEDTSLALIDAAQLESALVNLALNARDAMPKGGKILITISDIVIDDKYLAQEAGILPGHYVRVLFADNGEGMDKNAQKQAFEPFFTTKHETHGTGLGLSMVYGFVRQSGGHITLYSEVGYGTSFGLYFPAIHDGVAPPERLATPVAEKSHVGGIPCVLVVEDNAKVRENSLKRLAALGYSVEVAENADIAYKILQSGAEIDLVFSDVVMPGEMNGFDLAAKISDEFPHVKVLMTSGYASDIFTKEIPHVASYDILHKPYSQKDLAQRLHALFVGDSG